MGVNPAATNPINLNMKNKQIHPGKWLSHAGEARMLAILLTIYGATGCSTGGRNHEAKSPGTAPAAAQTKSSEPAIEHQALTGAELYAINCNRCHPERSPVERNAVEWKTILLHMRVRANLPAVQANAILAYLQANSGD
jgi:hypothetical protein